MNYPVPKRQQGMTLIELMTAITVLGVLVAIAVPSFRQFTSNSRTTAATNDLVTALNLARSEALRRGGNAAVCASSDGNTCTGSATWANGWIVFVDTNGNGTADGAERLQVWNAAGNGMQVSATYGVNTPTASIFYNSMGMFQTPAVGKVTFMVVAPACSGLHAGQTDVLIAGTIQTKKVACP